MSYFKKSDQQSDIDVKIRDSQNYVGCLFYCQSIYFIELNRQEHRYLQKGQLHIVLRDSVDQFQMHNS